MPAGPAETMLFGTGARGLECPPVRHLHRASPVQRIPGCGHSIKTSTDVPGLDVVPGLDDRWEPQAHLTSPPDALGAE